MSIYKAKDKTKDGKQFYFRVRYQDLNGERKQYKSKKYLTKKEAQDEELKYLFSLSKNENQSNLTFKELLDLFMDYKKDKVKVTTYKGYINKNKHL